MPTKLITRTIWLLSLIGLLADLAGQMLYPILPVYLRSIGFSVVLIGVLEGIAELTAGLGKGYFGRLSDQSGRRLPFVRLGYTLSALAKPMMVLFALPAWVFATRILDRLGKGLRTTARDAVLTDESVPQSRDRVFGFQRSVNRLGAVLGPLAALVYLYFFPGQYVTLFMVALGPGLLSAGLTFLLTDRTAQPPPASTSPADQPAPGFAFTHYWRQSPPEYRQVMGGLLVFALFRSSDVFLLLKMKEVGLADPVILGLYIFYNLVYAVMANPVGRLADRIGLKPTLLVGLGLFALVYEGMAIADRLLIFVGLLALYGLYAAATEGIAKAWISTISSPWHTATAVGTYAGLSSVGALIANVMAGGLWYAFGSPVMFAVTGTATLWVIMYLTSLEGLPREVAAVRKPGVVMNTDGDLTGSDIAPYAVENSPSTTLLTRPAYLALILLTACLSIGTVYTSYVAISTALRSPAPLTFRSAPTGRSGYWPPIAGSVGTPRPVNPAPASNTAGSRPPNGSASVGNPTSSLPDGLNLSVGPNLADRFDITAPTGTGPKPASIAQLLTDKRPPVPWLTTPIQPISTKGLLAGNSAEKLTSRLLAKPVLPPPSKRRPVRLYTVSALYTHVYERADKRSPKKPFLNVRKKVVLTALMERNGFIYVMYSTRKGHTRKGWLRKRAVRPVRLPTDLYPS